MNADDSFLTSSIAMPSSFTASVSAPEQSSRAAAFEAGTTDVKIEAVLFFEIVCSPSPHPVRICLFFQFFSIEIIAGNRTVSGLCHREICLDDAFSDAFFVSR